MYNALRLSCYITSIQEVYCTECLRSKVDFWKHDFSNVNSQFIKSTLLILRLETIILSHEIVSFFHHISYVTIFVKHLPISNSPFEWFSPSNTQFEHRICLVTSESELDIIKNIPKVWNSKKLHFRSFPNSWKNQAILKHCYLFSRNIDSWLANK